MTVAGIPWGTESIAARALPDLCALHQASPLRRLCWGVPPEYPFYCQTALVLPC